MTTESESHTPLLEADVEPVERVLFRSPLLCVVDYESSPAHPHFGGFGPMRTPRIGYPRRQCELLAEGHAPFVADATRAVFFGEGTVYRRRAIDPLGSRATVINLRSDALPAILDEHRRLGAANDASAFRDVSAPLDPRLHEESVALANRLSSGVPFDAVAAEEATLHLVSRTLAGSHEAWRRSAAASKAGTGQLEMVAFVKQYIREHIAQKMSLTEIAALIDVSPFYLCRFFRATTGQTVYQYQLQVRLAATLEMLPAYKGNLAALAMDLGFSSHSHLATLFKRAFGYSPGSTRQTQRALGLSLGERGL